MRVRFTSTVFGLRNVRSAISRLVRPVDGEPRDRLLGRGESGGGHAVRDPGQFSAGAVGPHRRAETLERRERLVQRLCERAASPCGAGGSVRSRTPFARARTAWADRRRTPASFEPPPTRRPGRPPARGPGLGTGRRRPATTGPRMSWPRPRSERGPRWPRSSSPAASSASTSSLACAQIRGSRIPASRFAWSRIRSSASASSTRPRAIAVDATGEPGRPSVDADRRVGLGQVQDLRRGRRRPRRGGRASRAPPRGSRPPTGVPPVPPVSSARSIASRVSSPRRRSVQP